MATGAYNLTVEAQRRSEAAGEQVRDAMRTVGDSERTREAAEAILAREADEFEQKYDDNEAALGDITDDINDMKDNIQALNQMVSVQRRHAQ